MGAIELVVLPVLAIVLAAAALMSWRRRLRRTKLLVALTALVVDAGLWLVATEPPAGPHTPLLYLLILVNLPIVLGLTYQLTGFTMNPRGARTYEDRVTQHRPEYDGYRGD